MSTARTPTDLTTTQPPVNTPGAASEHDLSTSAPQLRPRGPLGYTLTRGDMTKLEPLILLDDEPVPDHNTDELSLMPFAKVVAGTAVGTTGPFTIGVFADWGQGKTSVLKQAKSLIESSYPDVVTVWFNPWQYEKEEHLIVPLIATILREVENKKGTLKGTAKKWLSSLSTALRSLGYGLSMKAKVKIPLFGEVEVAADPKDMIDREAELKKAQESGWEQSLYYTAFQALEDIGYPKEDANKHQLPKLVLFVDDLDRCFPDQGLKLLESIKLVLAQKGFIFVLAVDRQVLDGYLAKRYKEEFGVADYGESGKSYLDKIIQLPLGLPPHRARFDKYIRDLLMRPELCHDSNKEIKQALSGLTEVLAIGSNFNPRNLVRFINNLIVDRAIRILLPEPLPVDVESLSLCAVARILRQHLGEDLYPHLVRSNSLCESLTATPKSGEVPAIQSLRLKYLADEEKPISKVDRLRSDLLRRLGDAEFLQELLQTEAGKRWLTDHDARAQVDNFYSAQREAPLEQETPATQQEIVERAIRDALEKRPGQVVSDEERAIVEMLDLSDSGVTDAGLVHLRQLTGLQRLTLTQTQVGDEGLAHLSQLTGLQRLRLDGTQVGDEGLAHLSQLTGLLRLWLDGTQVGDEGLVHLKQLTGLRYLALDGTQVGDEGLVHLKQLTNLQYLTLTQTQVGDDGLAHLSQLTGLQRLWLDGTKVTNAGLAHLAGLGSLERLVLTGTKVSVAGMAKLSEALPDCTIRR